MFNAVRQDRRRGFTLLELLVVLAIAGLLIAAVPPMVAAVIPGTELKTAARTLKIELRSARAEAIGSGHTVDVMFSTGDAAGYAIAGRSPQSLPQGISLRFESASVSNTSSALPAPAGQAARPLRFYPDGSSNGAVVSLRRGDNGYDLAIGWLLGDVTLSEASSRAL